MRQIKRIIIHCAATPPTWMDGRDLAEQVQEIRRWHVQERGWSDIGYHWIIGRDGSVATGRPEGVQGAHTRGHNTDSLGVCLIGGHGSQATDAPADHYTPAQLRALRELVVEIQREHPGATVHGHNEFSAKACPGFDAARWWRGSGPARTSPAQSTTVQASAVQIASAAGAGTTALGALDGTAQIVAIAAVAVVILGALWVMRERLRRWSAGWR